MDRILTETQRLLVDSGHLLRKCQKYKPLKQVLQWQIFGALTILIIFCYLYQVYVYFKFLHPDSYKGFDHSSYLLVQQYPTSTCGDVSFGVVLLIQF